MNQTTTIGMRWGPFWLGSGRQRGWRDKWMRRCTTMIAITCRRAQMRAACGDEAGFRSLPGSPKPA